jgi:hypothetical protein
MEAPVTGSVPNTFVAQIGDSTRIMLSGFDPPQWLVQRHYGKEWRTILYHRNRDAMLRSLGEIGHQDGLSIIRELPEWCPDPRMAVPLDTPVADGDSGAGGYPPSQEG